MQGDDEEYLIESYVDNDLLVRFNSDSGTNYVEQLLYNNAGTLTASTSSTDTSIQIATDTKLLINAKTGQYRPCLLSTGQTSANQQTEAGYWWANSSDAMNKITVSDGTSQNSTGTITLYKRTKFKSSIDAHEKLIEEYRIGNPNGWTDNNTTLTAQNSYLEAYWQGEDTSDSKGSYTLTNHGSATFTTGKNNNAFTLNGSDQYLSNSSFDKYVDFLSCWFYTSSTINNSSTLQGLIGFGNSNIALGSSTAYLTGEVIAINDKNSTDRTGVSNITINSGWHHLVIAWDSTNSQYVVYLNNSKQTVSPSTDNSTHTGRILSSGIRIGDFSDYPPNTYTYNGKIDELCIYEGLSFTSETNRDAFVDALYKNGDGRFYKSETQNFSAGYTFRNLPQDDCIYKAVIEAVADSTAEDLELTINSDGGSNYVHQELVGTSTTASASTSTDTSFGNMKVDATYPLSTEIYIFPATGKYRPMLQKIEDYSTNPYIKLNAGWWLNNSDSIDEIKLFTSSSDAISGSIKLYKIGLLS